MANRFVWPNGKYVGHIALFLANGLVWAQLNAHLLIPNIRPDNCKLGLNLRCGPKHQHRTISNNIVDVTA